MTFPRSCPGEVLSGLVDGQLDHQARERVQRHLVDCAGCRAARAAQAQLKTVLRTAAVPPVSEQLTSRLLGLAAPPKPADAADAAALALCHLAHAPMRAKVGAR